MTILASPGCAPLLGADFDAVRAALGPPLGCRIGNGELRFAYRGPRGVLTDAVVVADGVVVQMQAGLRQSPPMSAPFDLLGADVEAACRACGPWLQTEARGECRRITFAGAVILACEGRIVAVTAA
jgi:hypothetical protein